MPDALTLWSFLVLLIGGAMYVAMSRASTAPRSSTAMTVRRGWIARRRARGGITHRRDCVGVGYKSGVGAVHLTVREFAGHGIRRVKARTADRLLETLDVLAVDG